LIRSSHREASPTQPATTRPWLLLLVRVVVVLLRTLLVLLLLPLLVVLLLRLVLLLVVVVLVVVALPSAVTQIPEGAQRSILVGVRRRAPLRLRTSIASWAS